MSPNDDLVAGPGIAGALAGGNKQNISIDTTPISKEVATLKNEMQAIQHQQDQYINALVEVSSLTKRQLTRLLDRKVNVYLTAEEAIEYGIADEVI